MASRYTIWTLVITTLLLVAGAAVTAPVPAQAGIRAAGPNQEGKPAPTLWRPCPVNDREKARDEVVRRFERGPGISTSGAVIPAGISNLICGDENHSYYHIANRHGVEWTQKAVKTSENWREVADYAIAEALRNPTKVTYRNNNKTYCYSREVYLINKVRGIPVDVFHPNVVVRAQDGVIVTSFPANQPCR
jgi:hypothetical protein